MIQADKNLTTIGKLIKAFSETLVKNHSNEGRIDKYFKILTVLIIPLKSTYDVPRNALKALMSNSALFHNHIMADGKYLFESILELMNHNNK